MTDIETTEPVGEARALDLRGLKCPLPVLLTRRALGRLPPGAVLVVRCTDPLAGLDIPNLVRETGDALVRSERDASGTLFAIRRIRPVRIQCGQTALTADDNSEASKQ